MSTTRHFCKPFLHLAAPTILLTTLCGCTTPAPVASTPGGEWTAARLQSSLVGDDTWQGFNRTMFAVDDAVMDYVAYPISAVYCSIIPRPLVKGIDNAVENCEYPIRLFATAFRGEWKASWDETKRFCLNTTIGLGGLFDPARDWFDIYATDASFSGTLAAWGVPKGNTLVLPFVPRSNVRDASGYALDKGLDPKTYVNIFFPTGIGIGWTASLWPNYATVWSDPWDATITPSADRYTSFVQLLAGKSLLDEDLSTYRYLNELKSGTAENRRPPIRPLIERPDSLQGRWRDIAGYDPRTPALDTIRQRLFTPEKDNDFWWMRQSVFNGDFAKSVSERTVTVATNLPPAHYGFVAAPKGNHRTGKLVFVIPGIGGSRKSTATLAMGELLHHAGMGIVLCDDPFHWEYVRSANFGQLPGYLPDDARRFATYMKLILADLAKDGFGADTEVSVVGWSMGGLITSHLAAIDRREGLGFKTGKLLAINAPVSFDSIDASLSTFLAPTREWSSATARTNIVEITRRLTVWDRTHFASTPDISEEDARFTVATALGVTLPGLVAQSTHTNAAVSVHDYLCRHVKAQHPELDLETLVRNTGLLTLKDDLRGNEKLQMIHTRDDFLLSDDDRDFLDRTLGERITWFSAGAHCGMFFTPEFKDELLTRLGLAQQ